MSTDEHFIHHGNLSLLLLKSYESHVCFKISENSKFSKLSRPTPTSYTWLENILLFSSLKWLKSHCKKYFYADAHENMGNMGILRKMWDKIWELLELCSQVQLPNLTLS